MKNNISIVLFLVSILTTLKTEIAEDNTVSSMLTPASQIQKKGKVSFDDDTLEDQLDQKTIGTGAGRLNENFDKMSDVVTFGGMAKPHNMLVTRGGIEIMLTGKERIEGISAINTQYLNHETNALDTYFVPGKSTTDIGLSASAGKHCGFEKNFISLGIDIRSRVTWGKPQEVAKTTTEALRYGAISYGTHSHAIGIPLLYVRGIDLTLDISQIFGQKCKKKEEKTHKLKLGLFPLEIGRGISLGAAYLISPDVLSYAPVDVIQEFTPGFLLSGELKKDSLDYRLYLGIIKNLSGSQTDLMAETKASEYGNRLFPYRGSGVFNVVSACQLDWKCFSQKDKKVAFSPYLIITHEGAGKVILPEDSMSNMLTYGLELSAEQKNEWDLSFEFAKNIGSQYVFGIDTNTLVMEQRTCAVEGEYGVNPNTSVGLFANSGVSFQGYQDINSSTPYSATTDIIGKNATFLGLNSERQKKIDEVYRDSSSNGTLIEFPKDGYSLKNSDTRFRDPYINVLNGHMIVCDIGRYFKIGTQPIKAAVAFGYASGDNNPNKSLLYKNDHIKNTVYEGFIGIQEIYRGKMVNSAYLMSGAGRNPRVGSIPAAIFDEQGNILNTVEYPSPISGFNNLLYTGSSLSFIYEGCSYKWKWNPNVLVYGQPSARAIHNKAIIEKLNKTELDPFLGTEFNVFLEIISKEVEGFKFFVVGSIFLPGKYYTDLSQIPLNTNQSEYLKQKEMGNTDLKIIPTLGNSPAYFFNLGLEFKF